MLLMFGARPGHEELVYPVSGAAARHGASVEVETGDPREAYAGAEVEPARPVWPWPGTG